MKKIFCACTCTAIAVACMSTVANADSLKTVKVTENSGSYILCEDASFTQTKNYYISELEKIKSGLKSYNAISYVDTVEGLIRNASSEYAANRQYCNAMPEISRLEQEFKTAYDEADEEFAYIYNNLVHRPESNEIFGTYYSEFQNLSRADYFDSLINECADEIIKCEEFLDAYEQADKDFEYVYETYVKHEESNSIYNRYYSELKNINRIEDFDTLINVCVNEIVECETFICAYEQAEEDFANLFGAYASNEVATGIINTYYNELQNISKVEDFDSLLEACYSELLQVTPSSMEDVTVPVRSSAEQTNSNVKETLVAAAEVSDNEDTSDNTDKKPSYTADVGGFVTRCYNVALNREPEQEGYNYWTELLISGQKHGGEVGLGFIFSEEYTNKNKSNEEYVTDLYTMFFGREADTEGFNYWVNKLNAGEERVSIFAGFVFSEEFANLCQAYGIFA